MSEDISLTNRLSKTQVSASFEKDDLRKLFHLLQERLDNAAELEVARFKKQDQMTNEQYEKAKGILRDGYKLRPTLVGESGQELYGLADEVLSSPNFPDAVKSVYINSAVWLKVRENYATRNAIELFLDFSRPEILNFNLIPSNRTPNNTNFNVQGADATWVNGVFHEIDGFVNGRKAQAPWIHGHTVYDLLLWLFGFPMAFWICFKAARWLPSPEIAGGFLRAALLVYLFLAVLVGFRTLFHYARWVYPIVKYRYPRSAGLRHRALLAVLSLGILTILIYDVAKWALQQ